MGCKMLTNAVLTYLNRARHPDHSISNLLHIFENYKKLKPLVHKIKERAEIKLHTKICNVQLPLLEVQDNEARIQPLPSVLTLTKDQTNVKLRSSFRLPPDPKLFLAIVSDFIPLDRFSLKGESPIGETSPLSIDELCNVPSSSWILIEGVSGIGKSTLAYEMLKQWKDGTALRRYSYVLLLRLRNENVHQQWSQSPDVAQLIEECLNEQYIEPPEIKSILDNKGHNLLLILEGYDELPKEKFEFQVNVFQKLKSHFDNAVVIITTQPSLSYQLTGNILFTKTIEILGFSKSNQDRYIEIALKNNTDKIKKFTKSIVSCPIVAHYLNVPLHLAIMIEIFSSGTKKLLPQTITELYESFVMNLICRSSNDQTLHQNFKCLPLEKISLRNHCKSAYDNVFKNKKHKIFFDPRDSSIIGLTQKKSRSAVEIPLLHFTIQEFLAAYHVHIQNKPIEEKMEFLENINCELPTTMCFMTGLITSHENIQLNENNYFQLNLLHQLMEINDEALVSEVLKNRTIEVSRLSRTLTLQDFYVLGRCFSLSSCSWKFGFTLRGLTCEHIKMFVSGFDDVMPQSQQHPSLEHIVLSLNPIGAEGLATFLSLPSLVLRTISEFFLRAASLKNNDCFKDCITKFEHFDALKTFLFHDNEFKEGEQQQLIDVLCHGKLKNLKKVSFSSLSPHECFTLLSQSHLTHLELYELSLESVEALLASLTRCMTLECIELYQSPITEGIVERSLRYSLPDCTLNELKLINCEIDSHTAISIIDAAMHSPTLQVIDLSDNVIDDEGGCYIASKLCALYQKLLQNPAENITQLFLQHNCFTEESITRLTEELVQLPYNFAIHLSLQWKDFIETECRSSPATNVEESSDDNENDLILRGNNNIKPNTEWTTVQC
ncbi:PREDICTED: NACHT, LRR and PYD domains-containing protein 14-like [Amphimedon queenslandica]|uniref:NACHT domain-containing protein n=2 Tax=Amphimedon queenslandica TaxID=400682 RepID=A0AAN0JID6_AMPQE|nr:PREDICTED: NACHT, LRR and PYD domains-containing protein 14-like [Amphimedon queenslandica]|eukprot:XP_019856734.1 PREDICTED: NACHT, LRR and PYD domains-containing protein 14-like [Amphimedon queenslandica]